MIGLRLSPDMTKRLDEWAERKGISRSAAIREMIEYALNGHDQANRKRK
jgi:predicted DNA-binding protein